MVFHTTTTVFTDWSIIVQTTQTLTIIIIHDYNVLDARVGHVYEA